MLACHTYDHRYFLRMLLFVGWLSGLPIGNAAFSQLIAQETPSVSSGSGTVDFARDVRPILSKACFQCHGPDEATRQAELRLDVPESARTVITTAPSDQSEMMLRIMSEDADVQMPPADSLHQLSTAQKETLVRWLNSGAPYEEHWALAPIVRPDVPELASSLWCSNPIDAYVLQMLRKRGLEPNVRADNHTLVRRMHLDIAGLPPSSAAMSTFNSEVQQLGERPALARLIDRLFASTDYAEQMALPWLEAARYADTDGYQNDRYRYQHAWRDWVLRAFNDKMPYDQFLIEQLAGDLLPDPTLWQQVATGFGRNHRINSEDGSIPAEWLTENVVDRVDTFGTVVLGLTIGCARCHDHKYDPISQRDYYRLFAYFNNIAEHGVGPNNGNSPPFVELPKSWPLLSDQEDRAVVPEPVQLRAARKNSGNGLRRPQAGSPQTVMVMHELDTPRETYLLVRGQYNMPDKSELLVPNVPPALDTWRTDKPSPQTRLELAHWCVDRRNPLTARVAVNRLWQHFFGAGLVLQSDNFGSQGSLPSHPKLLDWLASELLEADWNLQHIQRLILTSSTYRQSSTGSVAGREADPYNRWLSRFPRRRLNAFALRDQALSASGLLVRRTGGPSAKPYMPEKIWSAISNNKYDQDSGENLFRRSLYTYWRRTIPPPSMMNFNAAAREVCSVRNEITNTPLQALTLMNNKTFVESAKHLATRMLEEGGSQLPDQLRFGFRLLTARQPTEAELTELTGAWHAFQTEFSSSRSEATLLLDTGEAPNQLADDTDVSQHAAMTLLATLMLNLDETITKE